MVAALPPLALQLELPVPLLALNLTLLDGWLSLEAELEL